VACCCRLDEPFTHYAWEAFQSHIKVNVASVRERFSNPKGQPIRPTVVNVGSDQFTAWYPKSIHQGHIWPVVL
jgi:hypothetical protein